ncbi:MAG: penicillin-binding protein 1A [Gammaproteobacteria bacterium]|nr:penicillin-binding protein 1A [Gammaproteobacteria bacterium]
MRILLKLAVLALVLVFLGTAAGVAGVVAAYVYVLPDQPPVDTLLDIQLQVPLRVYTRDGRLMAEFGEKRRLPVTYEEVPAQLVQAITAAEDDRYFDHPGVDYQGLARAVLGLLLTGEKRQGGSTITMQVARNFFLTNERTYERKIREIFLALSIERALSKEEILELYFNKILLGQRAWGVGAAAEVYYGKTLDELTLAETATIAGLPKAPSTDNPITNPDKARGRRAYVLRRMFELGFITVDEREEALNSSITTTLHAPTVAQEAPYLAEMVRADMVERFGAEAAYSAGYKVTTTLDSKLQAAATMALRTALLAYDSRHDYRGVLANVALPTDDDPASWAELLRDYPSMANLRPALVISSDEQSARIYGPEIGLAELGPQSVAWVLGLDEPPADEEDLPPPAKPSDVVSGGDVIYVYATEDNGWKLAQIPQVQGAFVSVAPNDGAIVALIGGFDYYTSKFNRAVQAKRQPGSAFKPFVYSAALANGLTPATIINDAPVVFEDAALEDTWRPENFGKNFYGPTRLREALVRSRNLVSIRVLRKIGIVNAIDHLVQLGFDREQLPRDLSLALGSVTLTPLELATEYAVFANGGFEVEPYYIERIEDANGNELFQADPLMVCADCRVLNRIEDLRDAPPDTCKLNRPYILADQAAPRILDEDNTWLVVDMMRDVVRRGTAASASQLGRFDLAGKTGTTNDYRDAWFSGFNDRLVATVWVGFDQERPLGPKEVGGTTALPAWIDYMRVALDGTKETEVITPPGLIRVKISRESGLRASADDQDAIFEIFPIGQIPEREIEDPVDLFNPDSETEEEPQPLF